MHKKFDSGVIEKKWQKDWEAQKLYDVGPRDVRKPKEYLLVEWPYPSGNLHIGHWYAFAVPDIYARYKRMTGSQVLFPMGFDAFGLPAENAAIKRGLDPKNWTNDNIAYMKEQLVSMGSSFAWNMTANSTDPSYYKWTQAMFTKFFENDIAYRGKGIVNWCPGCNTVIANEQVLADGTCERSGDIIEKREMPQWMIRITKYADRLTDDLAALDWPEHIKEAQRQWIGRSRGAEVNFTLSTGDTVTVFTTRPDTLFGATYLVLAPEHPLLQKTEVRGLTSNLAEVDAYVASAKQKDDQDRLDATKEKTGVKLEGIMATNPGSGEAIPVFVADYVLGGYGTGAIMAVPAHDERDNAFAKKFDLPIKQVVAPHFSRLPTINHDRPGSYALIKKGDSWLVQHYVNHGRYWLTGGGIDEGESEIDALKREVAEEAGYDDFEIKGKIGVSIFDRFRTSENTALRNYINVYLIELKSNSQKPTAFTEGEKNDGLTLCWFTKEELKGLQPTREPERVDLILQMIDMAEGKVFTGNGLLINSGEWSGIPNEEAKEKIVEKVGGKMTSTYRLRDWSIGRQRYWGVPIPIVYDPQGVAHSVPQEHLPWLLPEDVDFTPTGVAPLAKSEALKKRTEEIFGAGWTPEVETMDTFVDSSWYFLRYLDNKNDACLASLEHQKEWMPIDIYFGGAEHTTMHLLYSRFWQKALFDLGLVTESEPYKRRINRGLILGPDGNKMSKSKGNVIDPDEQVRFVGADTVKMYLAFMGPYEGNNYPWDMGGIAGVRRFLERVYGLIDHIQENESEEITRALHKTIKKVSSDITNYKFNTAISAMMIFVNQSEKEGLTRASYELFIQTMAPFAPYLTEEIWHELGHNTSIHLEAYPTYNAELATDSTVTIGVQINGKLRGSITIRPDAPSEEVMPLVMAEEALRTRLLDQTIKKTIYVPGKIINLIVAES